MCNYNMADTLDQSLRSILDQLDKQYEVLVVDDGSSDASVEVIKELQQSYKNLRLIELKRDQKRKLGITRNISIQEARGEYVFLNIDCDDIYDPYIKDFSTIFHQIEDCLKKDFYLSGNNINMGKREFLLQHGPYRNIFRGEDRDMWIRLAAADAFMQLDHVDFVTRLPKNTPNKIHRFLLHTWSQLLYDFRTGMSIKKFLEHENKRKSRLSFIVRMFRLGILLPVYFSAKIYEPIIYPEHMQSITEFSIYRKKGRGSVTEILKRYDAKPDFTAISDSAYKIFK